MIKNYRLLANDEYIQAGDWYMYTDIPNKQHLVGTWANQSTTVEKMKKFMNPRWIHLVVVGRNLNHTIKGNKLYE